MKKGKIKIKSPVGVISKIISNSIDRSLFITLGAVTLIPLAFLSLALSMNSWDSIYKDELHKQKLLATSLVNPIQLKIESYQRQLEILNLTLQPSTLKNQQRVKSTITSFANNLDNAVAVSLLLTESDSPIIGIKQTIANHLDKKPKSTDYIDKAIRYQRYDTLNAISPVFKSSISNKPVILLTHHIIDKNGDKHGTLFTEIEPNFIKNSCNSITFGADGHCTVIDEKNHVIASSNKAWEATRHNLTSHELAKALKKSNSGGLQYISSTNQQEMLGAYAKVKTLGWGVFITRPKSEIDSPLNGALQTIILWVVAGVLLALLITILVTLFVTKPLKALHEKTKAVSRNPEGCKLLPEAPKYSSNELRRIWDSFASLLNLYQDMCSENNNLSTSSKKDIHKVMGNLRLKNAQKAKNIDPITGLTNGKFFIEELRKSLLVHRGEVAGLILIEVDNYKNLIAKNNVELAKKIIQHVAKILKVSTRSDDMTSRYGNAGRFAIFINDCSPRSIQGTAKKLRSQVEISPIEWKGNTIYINLSIGIVVHKISEKTTVNALMSLSEKAMLKSKSSGDNKISTYQNKQIETA